MQSLESALINKSLILDLFLFTESRPSAEEKGQKESAHQQQRHHRNHLGENGGAG